MSFCLYLAVLYFYYSIFIILSSFALLGSFACRRTVSREIVDSIAIFIGLELCFFSLFEGCGRNLVHYVGFYADVHF